MDNGDPFFKYRNHIHYNDEHEEDDKYYKYDIILIYLNLI